MAPNFRMKQINQISIKNLASKIVAQKRRLQDRRMAMLKNVFDEKARLFEMM